jgi:hypothetical protein
MGCLEEKRVATQSWVRFPVGSNPVERAKCQFSLTLKDNGTVDYTRKLDYVQSRKETYGKVYCENVKRHSLFKELQRRLDAGENLLIIEVDGPHQESLSYYKEKYGSFFCYKLCYFVLFCIHCNYIQNLCFFIYFFFHFILIFT